MTIFFIGLHSICCLFLITCILMQSGRGGGLTESFASAESMFGAKTNEFMVRVTTILASIFLVTSLTLAFLSAQKEASLMESVVVTPQTQTEAPIATAPDASQEEAPADQK